MVSLFAHSGKVQLAWKDQVGTLIHSYSETCWWIGSQWEVMQQLMFAFGGVESYFNFARSDDVALATVANLLFIIATKKIMLRIELTSVIDDGKYLVQAIYKLEGDGMLALGCYKVIQMVWTYYKQGIILT